MAFQPGGAFTPTTLNDFKPTTLKGTTPSEPKSFSLNTLTEWWQNNIKKPILATPGKYDEYDKEAKSVFVSANELGDGVNIQMARPIGQSSYHDVAVVHGVALGSAMRPPEYNCAFSFSNTRGMLYAQVTTNQVFIANMKQRFLNKKLSAELLFINANDTLKVSTDYQGNDNMTNFEWNKENGKFTMGYMQAILPNLDVGLCTFYKTADRKSGISGAVRYHTADCVITGEYIVRGALADSNERIFKGSYYERVDNNTVMVAELTYDVNDRDAKYQYGFQQNYLSGKLRVTTDQNWQLKGVFDQRISPSANVQCSVDADPAKSDFKFGFSIQFG